MKEQKATIVWHDFDRVEPPLPVDYLVSWNVGNQFYETTCSEWDGEEFYCPYLPAFSATPIAWAELPMPCKPEEE